jgi:thiamine-phosphate pyrophosphorylase
MSTKRIDYSVYLVTNKELSGGRSTLEIVKAAVKGGVTCVQLREKTSSTREFIREAMAIKDFLNESKIPLIINDRVDVAMAVGADGIHLGQRDMPLTMARDIVKDTTIIGISAESLEDALEAERQGADYVGVSPIYATPTKTDTAPPLGLKGLKAIRRAVKLPLVGIGGLNKDNVRSFIENGGDGVAVVSAIISANDPEQAARDLKTAVIYAKNQYRIG